MSDFWIQTYSGIKFDLAEPRPEMVYIVDIAHALAGINRFTGHTEEPYSVADHSLRVEELCPGKSKLWGLLHDAAEAYIGDISTPLKRLVATESSVFNTIEARILETIAMRYNLPREIPASVWYADSVLLAEEAHDLFQGGPIENWTKDLPAPMRDTRIRITPHSQAAVMHRFLRRATELGIGAI